MLKKIFVIIGVICLIICVSGCFENIGNSENKDGNYNIKIETPIVFSHNGVKLADGSMVYVNIEMISGRYYFDAMAGAFEGANWNGQYQIRVYTNEFDFDILTKQKNCQV